MGGPNMKSPMTLLLFWFHVHSSLSRSPATCTPLPLEVLLLFSWTSFGGVGWGGFLAQFLLPPVSGPPHLLHSPSRRAVKLLPLSAAIFKRLEFSGSRGSAATHSVRISLEILKHILNFFFFSFVHAAAPNINTKSDHMAPTRAAIRAASQGRWERRGRLQYLNWPEGELGCDGGF